MFVSFQGEGLHAGRRHLFVRFAGCHLRCRYCDTPESLERVPRMRVSRAEDESWHDNPITPTAVAAIACELAQQEGPIDGVALTGGEPLLQARFIAELLREESFPTPRLLETSGTLVDRLMDVLPAIDCVSMDLKLPSASGETAFWEEHRDFLLRAGRKAYVKIPVDRDTCGEELQRAAALVATVDRQIPVFLQPITEPGGTVRIDAHFLSHLFAIVRSSGVDVRVVPQMHKMLGIR